MLARPTAHQALSMRALPTWRAGLLLFFAALFAFVFPFLCWGSLGDPSHPHAHAHFVFAEPPLRDAETDVVVHAVFHPAHGHFHAALGCGDGCDVAGQSHLDTLLVMLLIVLFFAWHFRHSLPTNAVDLRLVLGQPIHALPIPTPPPKPA